jgi:hypothetical protein
MTSLRQTNQLTYKQAKCRSLGSHYVTCQVEVKLPKSSDEGGSRLEKITKVEIPHFGDVEEGGRCYTPYSMQCTLYFFMICDHPDVPKV